MDGELTWLLAQGGLGTRRQKDTRATPAPARLGVLNWVFPQQACPFGLGIVSHSNYNYYQNINEHSLGTLRGAPTSPWVEYLSDER